MHSGQNMGKIVTSKIIERAERAMYILNQKHSFLISPKMSYWNFDIFQQLLPLKTDLSGNTVR